MSMSNKVRILYLESDNADADTVAALVGIVRQVQSGASPQLQAAPESAPPTVLAEGDEAPELPASVLAAAPRPSRKPAGERQRASGVSATVVAAVAKAKGTTIDVEALATKLYGSASEAHVKRARGALYAAATAGKIRSTAPGKYAVVG
jgi:hypothetical protein